MWGELPLDVMYLSLYCIIASMPNMNTFVETALRTFCSTNEIFGKSSSYIRFEEEIAKNNVAADGLNSEIKFGRIVYCQEGTEERISPPIMLKTQTRTPFVVDFVIAQFLNEITFHTRALPFLQQYGNVQPLLAHFYDSFVHASANGTEFVLIFENLKCQGFRNCERYSFLDLDHLSLMLHQLGRFHSYSYYAKNQKPEQFHALARWFHDAQSEMAHWWPNFLNNYADRGIRLLRNDPRYRSRLANVEKYLADIASFIRQRNTMEHDQPLSVLCHGDYLRGNIMFRYENGRPVELKMIDLATARLASPVIDLCGVLYLNANQQTRSQHWHHLIDSYYQGLGELFGKDVVPSKESILNDFKTKTLYAYFIATYFLPRIISLDRGLPDFKELLPEEYRCHPEIQVPEEVYRNICKSWGGEESTEALADILRDMIDRDFI